ncbi:MAG: NADH:flavin oxidoreductase, partial [Deltaproteobacteria bacterium]|nr:NADH:flavin oxidoreductase [Deltaproteobacteria bacterium]
MSARFPRVASLKTPERLRARLAELGAPLPCDDAVLPAPDSPLAQPLDLGHGVRVPNRFVVQPMEGWDGTREGEPTALTERRWRRFGAGGAGWVWGGEAVAVRPDGRANPNQLLIDKRTAPALG